MVRHSSQYPPTILDIEASGLGQDSYPIEVGYYRSDIHCFCVLIKPANHWTHWSEQAQSLHGIKQEVLQERGLPIREVALQLNKELSGRTVFSDAWAVDSTWFNKLFYDAKVEPTFWLSALETIMTEAMIDIWDDTKESVISELNIPRHRASSDAKIIQTTWLRVYSKTMAPEVLPT